MSNGYALFEHLSMKYNGDREWAQGKAIFECIVLRDDGEGFGMGTADHSILVALVAYLIAQARIDNSQIVDRYFLAGLLHDAGKLQMTDRILKSSDKLGDNERATLPVHVIKGVELLRRLNFEEDIINFCSYHHEKLNGSGYPYMKTGNEIPLIGRIAAVADVFGAMRVPRSYRPHIVSIAGVLSYLSSESHCYDQDVVNVLRVLSNNEDYLTNTRFNKII